ncbi:HesA/MoeB/ThiF family protein [Primorskyibacter sp. S87]|uniref:HesA/MoeB/ThiF family protein n=1 Tax=Primorskyibacter sp. S87 TaxID=3415126 RepID=UPI003C7E13A5
MTRYARQEMVLGATAQARLADARVLVVGAGGLAAPTLPLLAGAGIGEITIIDPDIVETSNLHRQTLFTEADMGLLKAQAAAQACTARNSAISVREITKALTPDNAPALIADADLVLDCADSYAASYTLSDFCRAARKPLISASVLGVSGYVGGFCGGAPSLRAVFPDAPDSGASCATAGVLGPVVGMIGAMQAQMALAALTMQDPSPLGQLVQLDAGSYRFSSFRFDTAPEPNTGFCFAAPSQLSDEDLIIELRDTDEAPIPADPRALRMRPQDVGENLPRPDRRLALCCASGLRSWRLAEQIHPDWPGEIVLVAAATS